MRTWVSRSSINSLARSKKLQKPIVWDSTSLCQMWKTSGSEQRWLVKRSNVDVSSATVVYIWLACAGRPVASSSSLRCWGQFCFLLCWFVCFWSMGRCSVPAPSRALEVDFGLRGEPAVLESCLCRFTLQSFPSPVPASVGTGSVRTLCDHAQSAVVRAFLPGPETSKLLLVLVLCTSLTSPAKTKRRLHSQRK